MLKPAAPRPTATIKRVDLPPSLNDQRSNNGRHSQNEQHVGNVAPDEVGNSQIRVVL